MATHDDLIGEYQRRTLELEALFETAGDLSSLHDVDEVLTAIVRRSRQLLATDTAYLMLLDEENREAYMRVSEGIQTREFMEIRLAYGEGLGGLVASTGMPQWTNDYGADDRFAPKIGATVAGEAIRAILGVPLKIGHRVTGVLLASDRRPRTFSHAEVALLSSLASHAAIALENASLHEASQQALRKWQEASHRIEEQNRTLEQAADLHERLTALVAQRAPVSSLAEALADSIGGDVVVLAADGTPLMPLPDGFPLPPPEQLEVSGADGAASTAVEGARIAPAQAGRRRLGYLVHHGPPLSVTDVRSLERAALVTALLLLDLHADEEALSRAMGDLVTELATRTDEDHGWARERARAGRLTLPTPPCLALVALDASDQAVPARLDAATEHALAHGGLARAQDGEAALILPGGDAAAAARDAASALSERVGRPVTVGATGPYDSLTEAARALTRARTCAKVLTTTGQHGRGATPEELGVYTLLFSDVGRDQIEEFVAETIGPVLAYDAARGSRGSQLARTLRAYFDVGGQTGALADALYVHVNTLYQRLERLDRLLGPDWRTGERSLQVHLALRLHGLVHQEA